ncbi:uncharacterized protein TNCV_3489171 [Trichonephila clavipes]|nr:uncharacterized protein TNCV_3489171 [Trichonephila clavipes]
MSSLEQRANNKFCILLEESSSEILKKVYGNDAKKKKRSCRNCISVFVKVAQTFKMTYGLDTHHLLPSMRMLSAFEKLCEWTDK